MIDRWRQVSIILMMIATISSANTIREIEEEDWLAWYLFTTVAVRRYENSLKQTVTSERKPFMLLSALWTSHISKILGQDISWQREQAVSMMLGNNSNIVAEYREASSYIERGKIVAKLIKNSRDRDSFKILVKSAKKILSDCTQAINSGCDPTIGMKGFDEKNYYYALQAVRTGDFKRALSRIYQVLEREAGSETSKARIIYQLTQSLFSETFQGNGKVMIKGM